jgi:hypothetical protein
MSKFEEFFEKDCNVHIERMDSNHLWIGISKNGVRYHFDITSKRKIKVSHWQEGVDVKSLESLSKSIRDALLTVIDE